MDIDFGYNQVGSSDNGESGSGNNGSSNTTNLDSGTIDNDNNGEAVDDINSIDDTTNFNNSTNEDGNNKDDDKGQNKDDDSDKPLEVGTTIEVGDETYTVDESGNLLDKNGNIFKESKDVKGWINSFEEVNETEANGVITIDSIREAVGIEITDDNDKPLEFENTPAGIKSYIDAVIDTAKEEHYEAAINTLYQKYPILNNVLNYYIANGNSLEGFGEVPDRSNITVDDNNEAQQEIIIKTAWAERNQKGDVDGYIAYLKSSGTLLATAKAELKALQEADEQYKNELAKEAERKEIERIEKLEKYWNGVHEVIKTRNIAGYQIPDSIIINRGGQKLSVTPEDFFNYIYRVDNEGKSAYERDLAKETIESRRDDEILRAYLKFVGGNYSNLVNMAINKEKVNKLKLRAKERNANTVRVIKPNNTTAKGADLDLGYN